MIDTLKLLLVSSGAVAFLAAIIQAAATTGAHRSKHGLPAAWTYPVCWWLFVVAGAPIAELLGMPAVIYLAIVIGVAGALRSWVRFGADGPRTSKPTRVGDQRLLRSALDAGHHRQTSDQPAVLRVSAQGHWSRNRRTVLVQRTRRGRKQRLGADCGGSAMTDTLRTWAALAVTAICADVVIYFVGWLR